MKILVAQLDGALLNRACARLVAHHRAAGDDVTFRRIGNASALENDLFESSYDRVFGSLIFERTRELGHRFLERYPGATLGGTGWDLSVTLEDVGTPTEGRLDYSPWPLVSSSIGFLQRGCRLRCEFCHVPRAEGPVREVATVADLWRGAPWPRDVVLLDNDPFGNPSWRERVAEVHQGDYRVSWTQGINMRLVNDEAAEALAGLFHADRLWNDSFDRRAIYTAWDSRPDERTLFRGLDAIAQHGVSPRDVVVYVLVGFDGVGKPARPVHEDDLYRIAKLREWGAFPYPMPYDRDTRVHEERPDREGEERRARTARGLVGLARWVQGYDRRIPWAEWEAAGYRPEKLTRPRARDAQQGRLFP